MDNDIGLWILALAPLIVVGVLLLVVGIVLIFNTVRRKVKGKLRAFQLLTGASALGIPVFAVLHNFAYMLGIMWFGENAFDNGDEPVFFYLALISVLGLLVGGIGTIIISVKQRRTKSV
ncbi:hypothetical protein ACFLV9_00510 [Chloroflexota bacterium]